MSANPTTKNKNLIERPPVVVIMGHIDHGKSTLLDYIRTANTTAKEAGGITQRIAAYEAVHTATDGRTKRITFIDTPGHEAFKTMRSCGAEVADIAILVVSGEEGVKPQTIDAYNAIKTAQTPMIVAVNKMDRPGASLERTKNSLLEHEIYVEGYGGDIPCVPISAKTGDGVSDLLDMIILLSDVEELIGNTEAQGKGLVIESHLDASRGISATIIIQDGTLRMGSFVATEDSLAPLRIMRDYTGKNLKEATIGTPIAIIGWDNPPRPGAEVRNFDTKKEALAWQEETKTLHEEIADEEKATAKRNHTGGGAGSSVGGASNVASQNGAFTFTRDERVAIPIIIKASSAGVVDAITHELKKLENDKIYFRTVAASSGAVTETDVKLAMGKTGTLIFGFDVPTDIQAKVLSEREKIAIETFDIIYKLSDRLKEIITERTPKILTAEETGRARILKIFNSNKKAYIIGGKVETGVLKVGSQVKLLRRDSEIGTGMVKELQQQKEKTREVSEGFEFGAAIEFSIEPASGDIVQAFIMVEK